MKILVVIDMQNDFIDGSLGTKEAMDIVPKVIQKIENFHGMILSTRDTHNENYLETLEGKHLPVKHCVINTKGWEIQSEIQEKLKESPINKPTFGSYELVKQIEEYSKKEPIEDITLIGLCTDICVISNAMLLKASFPETPIMVDAKCCAGVTPESHRNALETMKMCQIEILE